LAEREGFEPSVEALVPYNGLANRRFRPLSHLSTSTYEDWLDALAIMWQINAKKGTATDETKHVEQTFMAANSTPAAKRWSSRLPDRRDD
jgi:hypothetical protein